MIYRRDPEADGGYTWLHGVALAWHGGRLYCSFGHNRGPENTGTEEARGCVSDDGGRTWNAPFTIDAGEGALAVSHGVFLAHGDRLWAFHGSFYNHLERTHARAYLLDEATGAWEQKGVVVPDGFWPLQEPVRMADGNYIMAGVRLAKGYAVTGDLPAVAISHGDDLLSWELVVIPTVDGLGSVWGESTVIVRGARVLDIARWGDQAVALASVSEDFGRTWTPARPSNLPMAASKPYAGLLSTGAAYLICTTTADSGHQRTPLTIALSAPGSEAFQRVLSIRREAWMAYPYAVEHAGKLYVGYSVAAAQGANQNNAELSVIPLEALRAGL